MSNPQMPTAQEIAEFQKLKAENEALKAKLAQANQAPPITVKVSKAGAISVYGIGRNPTTLYKEQWLKVFTAQEKIQALINLPETEFKAQQELAIAKALTNPYRG